MNENDFGDLRFFENYYRYHLDGYKKNPICSVCRKDMTLDDKNKIIYIGGMTELFFHTDCYTALVEKCKK